MPIAGKLIEMYRAEGIDICTGLNSYDFNDLPSANFTRFIKDGRSMTEGLGIALQEVYMLECLFAAYKPRNVFIIGNSLGWSTLAMGSLLPESNVVAMDAAFEETILYGIELTNRIAARANLYKTRVIRGVSPQDVSTVVDSALGGTVDFAFIDGLHTDDQIVLDYEAVASKASPDAVYLFHDVHMFDLYGGIARIETLAGRKAMALRGTPSGMMMLYDPVRHPEIAPTLAAFTPPKAGIPVVEREAWRYNHPHDGRWRRSVVKRVNVLRRLAGADPLPLPAKS